MEYSGTREDPDAFATESYDYALPPELIAQRPIEPRDASRLMVVDRASGSIEHRLFRDLAELLQSGDLLVGNRSRVIPARLHGHKLPTGGAVEILLLRAIGDATWEALVRPGRRLAVGTRIGFGDRDVFARIAGRDDRGGRQLQFVDRDGQPLEREPFTRWLSTVGEVPLPPYIRERLADPERYQTIYAREAGSAAAPTAGLHFTPDLLFRLREHGVALVHVTLHVGLDTFRPVEVEDLREHLIHAEWCQLTPATAARVVATQRSGGRVVAVGTTSVRVLETATGEHGVAPYEGDTRLFVHPGHRFRAVDALVTNFHLPRSSLLMLVSAFAGRELILRAYREAIAQRYRFFSFGDAMLIL